MNDEIDGRSVGKRISEIVHVGDRVVKRVVRDLVGEAIGVADDVRKRGIVKVREVLVLGDGVGKRCEKVLRDGVGGYFIWASIRIIICSVATCFFCIPDSCPDAILSLSSLPSLFPPEYFKASLKVKFPCAHCDHA